MWLLIFIVSARSTNRRPLLNWGWVDPGSGLERFVVCVGNVALIYPVACVAPLNNSR
jgi:alanyl-tRNA synthetase